MKNFKMLLNMIICFWIIFNLTGCKESEVNCISTNEDNIEDVVNCEDETKITKEEVESNKKLEILKPEVQDISCIKYDILNKENYNNEILFQNKYCELEGISCFRGNNYRNTASYGISNIKDKKLEECFKFKTSSSSWGAGAGWTGQSAIIRWPEDLRKNMNIYDEFKEKEGFTEVIYASLDGNIYFIDLDSGKESRNKIHVGNPIKGSLSVDPRGLPLLYTGEGIVENGIVGFNIYSLIDGSKLYEINGMDEQCYRGWPAFDGSCLIYSEGDTVIEGGENGLLYIIKLNSNYDITNNKISLDPKIIKYRYSVDGVTTRLGIENSVACYGNLLYFADNNGNIQCFDLNELKPIWIIKTNEDTDATLTIEVENDIPYIYTGNEVDLQGSHGQSVIRKINGLNGNVVWKKSFECYSIVGNDPVNGGVMSTNVIGKNNINDKVIFSLARYENMNKGVTIALDKTTGEIKWKCNFDNYMWSSPVDFYDKDGNGYLIQCDSIGNMFLIDGENGNVLNKITLDGNVEASPVIFEDKIVVATRSGTIYGVRIL